MVINEIKQNASAGKIMFLVLGEILGALSIYFIKNSTMNPLLLASGRQMTAALILLPLFVREIRQDRDFQWKNLLTPIIPGILLGIHFITWNMGARMIPGANATLIVTLTPAVTPFFLLILAGERVTKWEGWGSLLAILGSIILAMSDLKLNREFFTGDLLCLISMVTFSIYMVFSKRYMKGIWTYLVPLYFTGGIFCFLASLMGGNPWQEGLTNQDWIAILGLGLVCTVGSHSIMNWAMKHIRGQIVSLFHTTQFLYAGIIGLIFFGELPEWNFLLAALIILTGLILPIVFSVPRKVVYPPRLKH
jgi:drug/metabolite transporter (DMT)-like permease